MTGVMTRQAQFAAALIAAFLLAMNATAQDYPNKPIRMVIPIGVGGDTDLLARTISDGLSRQFGQPVVPENRVGGAGLVAASSVANAAADGYTLMFANTSLFISPFLTRNVAFDAQNAFVPVGTIGRTAWSLLANAEFPAKNMGELIALAKAAPGKYSYSSGGSGSTSHLSFEIIKSTVDMDILHVPYKGGGDGNLAMLRNDVQMTLNNAVFARSNPGKIRIIATTGDSRSSAEADVPNLKEGGVNVSIYVWMGVVASARTPRPIILRLNRAINDAIRVPETNAIIGKKFGYEIRLESPEQVGAFMASEFSKWSAAVKLAGIKPTD
ncbi:MAG: tripartite tricarboxylate transporter substrate binding protein [Betaproteobacteria bacterium]|nr:tripartite tricarboxylate transporter substrate binding protein [Betaproteobacteria bacterium]